MGFELARRLDRTRSADVVVIERDAPRGEYIAGQLRWALVLNGDGTNLELLESEGIGRSDVLVSVIDNDERNLLASLLARQLGVKRVITRVTRLANLKLFERVGIDVAISARGAAVASVLHAIESRGSRLLAVVEEGAGRILELDVPAKYRTRALRELRVPRDSIVGAIVRDTTAFVPSGEDDIRPGDRLIVFSTEAEAANVREFFTSKAATGAP